MYGIWLDADELHGLTGYRRVARQKAALADMGIKFRTRPADGFPLVLREDLTPAKKRREPDFSALTET